MDKSALASHFWTENDEIQKEGKLLEELKHPVEENFLSEKFSQNSKFSHPQRK